MIRIGRSKTANHGPRTTGHLQRIAVLFFVVSTVTIAAPSQQDTTPHQTAWTIIGNDLSTSVDDAGLIFTAPLHWDVDNGIDFAGVLFGTAACMTFDSTARRWTHNNQSTDLGHLADVGRFYGQTYTGAGIAGGVYLGGLIFKNEKVRVTGRMIFESLLFSGVVTTVLKSVVGRSRPYTDDGPFMFHALTLNADHLSFPSGHATVAFAVSSVIAARFNNPMAYILSYGMATVTALSRIYNDQHWMSDTFLGACIGAFIGNAVVSLHSDDNASGHAWRISPTLNGVALVGRF